MPDRTTTATVTQLPQPLWTGRLDFELINRRGWTVATIDVVVRIDTIELWHVNRSIAVIDRNEYRAWLDNPHWAFASYEVVWTLRGPNACISIDHGPTYPVDPNVMGKLRKVV